MTQKINRSNVRTADKANDCRVIDIGIGDFAECAQWGPVTCEHSIPFGYSFLCMHPRVKEMIENTKKVLSAEKNCRLSNE